MANARVVSVKLGAPFDGFKYAFRTTIDAAKGTVLGQILVPVTLAEGDVQKLIFGANSPKPRRASKRFAADGQVSSFISIDAITAAKAAGWKVGRAPATRTGKQGTFSKTRYVLINGVKRAWNMPKSTFTGLSAANQTALKIKTPTAADTDLVFGCEFPLPPKAQKIVITGDETVSVGSFCDNTVLDSLPAGFTASKGGRYLPSDFPS
jgi:hypothetical protein